ncbi:alpha-(1,3)-fucosyltransferase 10 [Neocloeon triangulifer]|uniref:alpha-(1,3)-fucosyltransferase 10 n=1 Tax=Neocloeon triangulifer TaxID=2078957 RepID=UPI00286EE3B3|nr:alpha-(1,3)-fucosyltransferase 10 [Neocloeon triangulifer]
MCRNIFLKLKIKYLVIFTTLLILVALYHVLSSIYPAKNSLNKQDEEVTIPTLLWWTPFTGEDGIVKKCNVGNLEASCYFTNNRNIRLNAGTKVALLFYGSSFAAWDLPEVTIGKKPLWALLHEESPRNSALLQHKDALSLFNFSATFSRHSSFPLTLQHLTSLEDLVGNEFFVSWKAKTEYQQKLGLAPVVFIQSDCDTSTDRDTYVKELMKFIKVDSYGACLQNKKLPESIRDPMLALHSAEFWKFQARYKFSIAIENAECPDYLTEKLWRPLIIGSIPIYYGSISFQDWMPFDKTAISVRDFDTPETLAKFIAMLDSDEEKYMGYLEHKKRGIEEIENKNLVRVMKERTWSVGNRLFNNFDAKTLVEEFECFVCQKLHQNLEVDWHVVNVKHCECPPPVSPLEKREMNESFWYDQWHQGKFEAQLLRELVESGERLSQEEFYEIVGERKYKAFKNI